MPQSDNGRRSIRVPPLVLSRLERGGKTTILHLLFKALKDQGFAPIYISFNGSFDRFPGETAAHAILRLIAVHFIDNLPAGQDPSRYDFNFSEAQVLQHLDDSSGGRPVILLIDELNVLGLPIDTDGTSLLCRQAQRYVVFSTTVLMDLDTTIPTIDKRMGRSNIEDLPSPRGYVVLPMRCCQDAQYVWYR